MFFLFWRHIAIAYFTRKIGYLNKVSPFKYTLTGLGRQCIIRYMSDYRRVSILGVDVDLGYEIEDVTRILENHLIENKSNYICTTNPEFIMAAQKDTGFRDMINNASLSLPDGSGIVMADYYKRKMSTVCGSFFPKFISGLYYGAATVYSSFFKRSNFAPKITGVAVSEKIFELCAAKGYSVFLLGGMVRDKKGKPIHNGEDIATIVAESISKRYPKIKIVGSTSRFSYKPDDDISTIHYIKKCMEERGIESVDFILVAYGQKKQESWMVRNLPKIPCKIGVGVGGTFDYLSGVSKKPSEIVIQNNLEWLHRLFTQPWRFTRIISAFPTFPFKVFISSLK